MEQDEPGPQQPGPREPGPDLAHLLAQAHAARLLARKALLAPEAAAPGAHELWAHVRREPGAPVSLALERAIRGDAQVSARYRAMLASVSVASAPFAVAAADGRVLRRRVGPCTLEILEDAPAPPLLVIHLGGAERPSMMEIARGEERLRVALPAPTAGTIVLSLDPASPEAATLEALARDARCEIFLL